MHPRDLSENQQMLERLEALYQEVYPEQKDQVQQMIRTFEGFLDGQNPRQIQGYRRYLEKAVSVLEYYDPFEEEFDASEDDWDLWDEEEAQDPDGEETSEEEFWKKEGMIIRGPADSIPDLTADVGKYEKRNTAGVCTTGERISPGRIPERI